MTDSDVTLKDANLRDRVFRFHSERVSPNLVLVPYSGLEDYSTNVPGHIEQIREINSIKRKWWESLLGRLSDAEQVFKRSLVFCEIDDLVFECLRGDSPVVYNSLRFKDDSGRSLSGRILDYKCGDFFIFPGGHTTALDSVKSAQDIRSLKPGDKVRVTGCPACLDSPLGPDMLSSDFAVYCLEKYPLNGRRIERADWLLTAQNQVLQRNYSVFGNWLGDNF